MRLPPHIQAKWAEDSSKLIEADIEPEFSHLTDFVEKRAAVANTAFGKLVGARPNEDKGFTQRARRKSEDTHSVKVTTLATQGLNGTSTTPSSQKALGSKQHGNQRELVTTCLFCNGNHNLERCFKFRDKSFEERTKFVMDKRLCVNCLRMNHFVRRCRQFRACLFSGCGKRHHSLLHPPDDRVIEEITQPVGRTSVDTPEAISAVNVDRVIVEGRCAAIGTGKPRVSLRVVPVRVSGTNGGPEIETYAFLDDGSDITLCSNSLAETLGLSGKPMMFSLTTVNDEDRSRRGFEVELNVKALTSDDSIHLDKVWTVDRIPVSRENIPTDEDVQRWSHLHGIEFPKLEGKNVEILIGNDNPEAHWVFEQRCGKRKQPYAARTLLGWTLIGPLNHRKSSEVHVNFISGGQEMISSQLKRLYDADFNESLSSVKQAMSIEDQRALAILESSVCIRNDHYQLPLPWRFKSPCLPNNRDVAVRRMRFLERRFQKDPALFKKYKSTVEDCISRGHARRVPDDHVYVDDKPLWYLPHHPVFHPQKPGKVRVVFDCAARFRDTSLNDQLLQGPDLTNNLAGVLLRFRQEPVALMSDIEQMFHQVLVAPDDCHALRFLWWENGNPANNLVDHQMLVHLFGAKSSPCCASFALRKTALDNQSEFDVQTVDTVNRNFYVDDCLKSVATVPEANGLVRQLTDLLSKGGFHLTKWISNCREVLEFIPASERAQSVKTLEFEDLPIDRALGTQWNVEKDTLSFRVSEKEVADTRRGILSLVSGVYDPLGFAAPFVLPAKMILQELCKQDFGWDDQIPDEKLTEWRSWVDSLPKLKLVSWPRCMKPRGFGQVLNVQLHHFSDASEKGYGAASYIRLVDVSGHVHSGLLLGKARVAPLKTITIPRMELTAATVAVKLHKFLEDQLDLQVHKTVFWTDSTIVLQYIRNEARRFQTFVANRLSTIHDASSPCQWRYVDSQSNPADYASRGLSILETEKFETWLIGPAFLRRQESEWPQSPFQIPDCREEDPELKRRKPQIHLVLREDILERLLRTHSSFNKLQASVAWLLRFREYLQSRVSKIPPRVGNLMVGEISRATREIVQVIQAQSFPKELEMLSKELLTSSLDSSLSPSSRKRFACVGYLSPLRKLSPFIHNGIICVGGRLERAPISFDAKHPMILPGKNYVTDLIIKGYHEAEGHIGANQVLTSIRRKFWILQGHSAVRRVIGRCLKCRQWNALPCQQVMAPLPSARVTPQSPPFSSVGVDYFGPILVKLKRSHVKRYGCLFTCLAVRAVHIEIAHDLTSDSFIQAFSRFVSRRGSPVEIFSDNGTNFRGAEVEIKTALEKWNIDRIDNCLRTRGVAWHFNPPSASHTGGVWERIIRSIRKILRSLLGDQLVDDETLLTFMSEVEKILNDRPLTPPSSDPQDLEPLTPSKLLLLRPNVCQSPRETGDVVSYASKRWKQAHYLADVFWKRWIREYLPALQLKQKWLRPRPNLAVGDLVLVVDETSPRGHWPKAVVQEVFPDKHGIVRQVLVRTASSVLRRDVRKLCLLEGALFERD